MGNDILIDLGIGAVLRVLKNKREASKWKRAMFKVFKAIAEAYRNDADFQNL